MRPNILGNFGDDTIYVEAFGKTDGFGSATKTDTIAGGFGDDTIDASNRAPSSSSTDTLVGGRGNDVVFAGATVDNIILGNQGDDAISDALAGAGTDTIAGGLGDDTIVVGTAPNTGENNGDGSGFILIDAVSPADGTVGADDLIYGNEGSNSISVVGAGDDTIYGGSTSTTLFETVTGGAGADVFRFASAGADSTAVGTDAPAGTASGNDVIADMVSGTDKIAATGSPISNVENIGSVTGTSLNAAAQAAEAILTRQYGAGTTNGAPSTFSGSTDTYALVTMSAADGTGAAGLLVDIEGTTTLAKGDVIA